MNATMLNLMYFIICLTLFLQHGEVLNVASLLIMVTETILMVGTFVKFVLDPVMFDYFRFSFAKKELAMRHYCIYTLALVLISILFAVSK